MPMCSQPLWPCCPAVVVAGDADDDDGDADADDGDADDEAASSCKGQPGRKKKTEWSATSSVAQNNMLFQLQGLLSP